MQKQKPIPDAPDDEELLTPLQVAEMLNCAPKTLEDWRSGRNGPPLPYLKLGKMIRYTRGHVRKLLADALQLIDRGAAWSDKTFVWIRIESDPQKIAQ